MDVGEITAEPESRHPWEEVRARFFLNRLRPVLASTRRVLDVGAGDGYIAGRLVAGLAGGAVVAFDPHYDTGTLQRLSAATPGVRFMNRRPDGPFDLVLLLDVLEHLEDDRRSLRELVETAVAPGGTVLVSVPAWPRLFTKHDERVGHCRRYHPRELHSLVEGAGLRIVERGGLYPTLLFVRAAEKLVEKARGVRPVAGPRRVESPTGAARFDGPAWLRRGVNRVLGWDAGLCGALASRGIALPGLSTWVLASKETDAAARRQG